MLRKGFTLIELLIVITIIAILAGAALPYVQDYVEDARLSKAKSDMAEIKNALVRWEIDNSKMWPNASVGIDDLVGPYLEKNILDPWGMPYVIDGASSLLYCSGPNVNDDLGLIDDFSVDFRPPPAITKAYWIDMDKDNQVSNGDNISLRFSRPMADLGDKADWTFDGDGAAITAVTSDLVAGNRYANLTLTIAAGSEFAYTPAFSIQCTTDPVAPVVLDTATLFGGPFPCRDNVYFIKPL